MYMIEISEDKVSNLSEYMEKGIKYMGKAMQCIEELKECEKHNERRSYRDDRDSYDERMNERGRYGRY